MTYIIDVPLIDAKSGHKSIILETASAEPGFPDSSWRSTLASTGGAFRSFDCAGPPAYTSSDV